MSTFRERLNDLLESDRDLPALPEAVAGVQAAGDDTPADAGAVARIIERDPALRARLLRAADSPYYRRSGPPAGTAAVAVGRLGVGDVRALCLALGADRALGAGAGAPGPGAFWTHSAAVGMAARLLRDLSGAGGTASAEEVLAAGLLHDVGILLLQRHFPADFRAAQVVAERDGVALWRAEASVLGVDHGMVGALLLGRWKVAAPACAAVADHHHPGAGGEAHRGAAAFLHAAESWSGGFGLGLAVEGPPDLAPPEVLSRVGLHYEQRVALGTALELVRAEAPGLIGPS